MTATRNTASQPPIVKAAVAYAGRGWPVFPLRTGLKTPATPNGFKDAVTDPDGISTLFSDGDLNIGIATGSGLLVVDIDRKHGKDGMAALDAMQRYFGELPDTLKATTPSGGEHWFYSYPANISIQSRADLFHREYGKGLDIRADGGYVGASPSRTDASRDPSGKTATGHYKWLNKLPVAELPGAWVETLRKKEKAQTPPPRNEQRNHAQPNSQLSELQDALLYVPADPYEDWISVGKALYPLGGDGFGLWDTWSRNSAKYDQSVMQSKWNSFSSGASFEPAFVFNLAARNGWQNPRKHQHQEGRAGAQTSKEPPKQKPWPQPLPLHGESAKSIPFPMDALPPIIAEAVQEVVNIVQCPVPIAVNSALAAMAAATQGIANVKFSPRMAFASPLSLMTLVAGDPNERKTSADSFFSDPLSKWSELKSLGLAKDCSDYTARLAAWNSRRRGLERAIETAESKREQQTVSELTQALMALESAKPSRVYVPSLILKSLTAEGLGTHFRTTWPGAINLTAEAGSVFGGHSMGRDRAMANFAQINDLWDGKPLVVTRVAEEASYALHGIRFSAGLAIQPEAIRDFFAKNGVLASGTGLFARFLMAWPDSTQGTRMEDADVLWQETQELLAGNRTDLPPAVRAYHDTLGKLLDQQYENGKRGRFDLQTMYPSRGALDVWVKFHNDMEALLLPNSKLSDDAKRTAGKVSNNASRLAAGFDLFDGKSATDQVGEENTLRACRAMGWFLNDAMRFFNEIAATGTDISVQKLDNWLVGYANATGEASISKTLLRQRAPSQLRNMDKLNKALETLVSYNRVRITRHDGTIIVEINPALLQGGNRGA